jgi:sugar phosphate isomerase/epimerase
MKLGFLTACLPGLPLEQIAEWAAAAGFQALEVAAWPSADERPFTAAHIAAEALDMTGAASLRRLFEDNALSISSLAYYENNLHADQATREAVNAHVHACIDAAALLGCPTVGTFVGRDITRSVKQNIRAAEQVFPPLVEHASRQGIQLVIENCPMEGWHPDAYPANLAYSPELWDWLTSLGLWLNYDPSHLVGLGIDPVTALRGHVDRVAHVQAKDVEVLPLVRNRYGFFGKTVEREDPWDHSWWRFRIPGLGEVDWRRIVDVLYEGGFDGTISVEHEDPVWGGTEDRTKQGLAIACRTLKPLLVDDKPQGSEY